jgi:hypothetical protein
VRGTFQSRLAIGLFIASITLLACSAGASAARVKQSSGAAHRAVSAVRSLDGPTYFVSPNGSDSDPGTLAQPWKTLRKALTSLGPGDTLFVRGGTYSERLGGSTTISIRPATASQPILVQAYPGERPVLEGLLWLRGASYWTIDGLNVTWRSDGTNQEHMVKFTDGVGWRFTNGEIWGARAYAGLYVAGTITGQPANWRVDHSCVHDTYPSNNTNQDHNIYVNSGLDSGQGSIDHNLLFNATNGEALKMGGPSAGTGGAANIEVSYNTMVNSAMNVLIAWGSHDNELDHNLFVRTSGNYGNIRGYQLTGANDIAHDNLGYQATRLILNDSGYTGVVDGGKNVFPRDPSFTGSGCSGFVPQDAVSAAYGYLAGAATAPPPPPPPPPAPPANTPPLAVETSATTVAGKPVDLKLVGSDVQTCELSYSIVSGPANGTLGALQPSACTSGAPNLDTATITYTPRSGFAGSDQFTFKVSDGTVDSTVVAAAITVTAAPVVLSPTFRSVNTAANQTASTLAVPAPAGVAAGDVLLAAISVRGQPTITAPSGWTRVRLESASSTMQQAVYVRVAGSSEPASYTWTFSSAQAAAGTILAYSGVDRSQPVGASSGRVLSNTASLAAPSVTAVSTNAVLVGFYGSPGATSITAPAGMTERSDVASTSGTYKVTSESATQQLSAAGATGDRVALSGNSAAGIAQLVVLNPA